MKRGVIIIAAGHPYYAHMAYNLALSIRCHSDIPITLFYQGIGLTYLFEDQIQVFTDIQQIPIEYYMVNGKEDFIKIKTHLYDLTPYEETLYLDADMIFSDVRVSHRRIEDIFHENQDRDIQFACRGEKKPGDNTKSEWVNLTEIEALFGFSHWYELSSEVIYFKQSETAEMVFEKAKYYYSNHGMAVKKWYVENGDYKLEEKANAIQEFAGSIPDEVPFALALESLGVKIKSPYEPSYWQPHYFNKTIPDADVQRKHYLVSAGGAGLQPNIERLYNTLVKFYSSQTIKKRFPYQLVRKSKIMPERKKV